MAKSFTESELRFLKGLTSEYGASSYEELIQVYLSATPSVLTEHGFPDVSALIAEIEAAGDEASQVNERSAAQGAAEAADIGRPLEHLLQDLAIGVRTLVSGVVDQLNALSPAPAGLNWRWRRGGHQETDSAIPEAVSWVPVNIVKLDAQTTQVTFAWRGKNDPVGPRGVRVFHDGMVVEPLYQTKKSGRFSFDIACPVPSRWRVEVIADGIYEVRLYSS